MVKYDDNIYVEQLPTLEFFQGDTVTIPFKFVNSLQEPIDLRFREVYWRLCPFGRHNSPILILDNITPTSTGETNIVVNQSDPSVCYVNLETDMTKYITPMKYTQQPIVSITKPGPIYEEYIRAQGNIIFKPRIKKFDEVGVFPTYRAPYLNTNAYK